MISEVTIRDFKEIIHFTIEKGLNQPILGLGAPGIGKSESIKEIAEKLGYHVEDLRLAQMSEVEIGGLIYPNESKTKTSWLKPDWFPEKGGPKTVLLLDEITSANKRVQVAAYQLVLDRRIGKHTLPDDTVIIALGNGEEDGGVYVELAAPLADRFEIYNVQCSADVWLEDFARVYVDKKTGQGINPLVTSFIGQFPSNLHTQSEDADSIVFATPRSWKRVSDTLNAAGNQLIPVVKNKIKATVGEELGSKFILFCDKYKTNDLARRVANGEQVEAPKEHGDILFLVDSLTSMFAEAAGKDRERAIQIYENASRFSGKLGGEYGTMLIANLSKLSPSITTEVVRKDTNIASELTKDIGKTLSATKPDSATKSIDVFGNVDVGDGPVDVVDSALDSDTLFY